ncbi:heavy metal translocating P-type ATPase [Mastigocoleus testarum]|uniref:Cadmium-transporting ATPase n=1 Tax=Mastigocoleus testarum BC008 TaxID=371196 RepID=A0A0V7ZLQ0_9CYAN|nr:cation-translocating P-type ATPase [Mastigocoleus testarum]KST65409.1 cadmium-transporting ATPase [Mastigocoleus testarum BC008]KST70486.1 cadmium-transporting ATPase [Mastigocoleus testarum BC008]
MQQASKIEAIEARVHGMDCPSCAQTVQSNLHQLTGVNEVALNFGNGKLNMTYNPEKITQKDIFRRVEALGYQIESIFRKENSPSTTESAKIKNQKSKIDSLSSPWKFWLTTRRGQRVILSGTGLVLGFIAHSMGLSAWIQTSFYCIGIVLAGFPIARAGLISLKSRRADINLLMMISGVGACLLGDFLEGAMVVFLFSLGTTLQSFTLGRTRNAIRDLMDLTPPIATIKRGDEEVNVPISSIEVGEIITVRPGQRIALDGKVIYGISAVDQSPITGESVPVDKEAGDDVFGGTLNQTGYLEVKTTRKSNETTMARIIHLVEEAQGSRARSQQWVDKFASIYTPLVILLAIAIAIIPTVFFSQDMKVWIYHALVLLVIACPCALVISTPVSIVSAIGAATRKGILFKGGNSLETAGKIDILAFDKTGTLTEGLPKVLNIYSLGEQERSSILQIAASLEQRSEHPLAKAIIAEAKKQGLTLQTPHEFVAIPGKGIQAKLSDKLDCGVQDPQVASLLGKNHLLPHLNQEFYMVGNRRLFTNIPPEVSSLLAEISNLGQTPVLVGTKGGLIGIITLADGLRLEAREAVRLIETAGPKEVVILTGDSKSVAQQMVEQLGIFDYRAELLPKDKLLEIQRLQEQGIVGMVGDGINDAPALASADISFAIGRTDIALETADVVLVADDLRRLAYAISLSRKTVSVIQQNIIFSLITKALFLLLGSFGFVGLAVAVLADTGSSLLVTFNGMRLFKV